MNSYSHLFSLKIAIDDLLLYLTKTSSFQLLAANVPMMYRSTLNDPSKPAVNYIANMLQFDEMFQQGAFGVKPHMHMLLASHVASGISEVVVWRNTKDVEPTRRALRVIIKKLGIKNISDLPEDKWQELFKQELLGKIVERVPIENAQTGEPVTHLQI